MFQNLAYRRLGAKQPFKLQITATVEGHSVDGSFKDTYIRVDVLDSARQ